MKYRIITTLLKLPSFYIFSSERRRSRINSWINFGSRTAWVLNWKYGGVMNVAKHSIPNVDSICILNTTQGNTLISVAFAGRGTIMVTISSCTWGVMRVKGIFVIIVARCSKQFRLNNIMNLSTLACIDSPAPNVIKDSTRKVIMKNIIF